MPAQQTRCLAKRYSPWFTTLYDEPATHSTFASGAHYSVLGAIVESSSNTLSRFPQVHSFVIVWDGDHDERVIKAAESMYANGMLLPVVYLGERKGRLTIVVDERRLLAAALPDTIAYTAAVEHLKEHWAVNDVWEVSVITWEERHKGGALLDASAEHIKIYLDNIDLLWKPGKCTPLDV